MKQYHPKQCVELFHLLFLSQLGRKIDKRLYALKGGCNMRFYFKSIRYSEDMDIDIKIINKDTLLKNVNNILHSTPFKNILQARGLEIINVSSPKQTLTTQRWKIELQSENITLPLHTKIEFSRRTFEDGVLFEPIDSQVIRQYFISPFMANHYSMEFMFRQKVTALALRGETQSRDIFDLYFLIGSGNHFELDEQTIYMLTEAIAKAEAIAFEDFKGQVLAYLPDDLQKEYNDKSVWNSIVTTVIQSLNAYQHEIN